MLLQRKVNRAFDWQKEQVRQREAESKKKPECETSDDLPPMEDLIEKDDGALEKGDLPAMIVSALITILPACIFALLFIVLVVWFIMGL